MLALLEDIKEGKFSANIMENSSYFTKWANCEKRKPQKSRCSNHCQG